MLSCWGKANFTPSKVLSDERERQRGIEIRGRGRGIETRGRGGGLVGIPPLLSGFHRGFPAPLYLCTPNRNCFHWIGQGIQDKYEKESNLVK